MGAIMKFMDKYIIPVAGKLGAQKAFSSCKRWIRSNDTNNYDRSISNASK
ncbi:hypothetical protein Q5M85_05195 [Paraclostridium bifermentans]|nr:hypothetical protein [Paraclostridium bifermentans]